MICIRTVGHAPVDVVVHAHPVTRSLALVAVAAAAITGDTAAAIVVADQVILAVIGVVTGTDPGYF